MAGTSSIRPLILVAHAETGARTRMTKMLRQADFDTAAAYNGRQALELLRQNLVQVAILDAELPHHSGLDVVRAAAEEEISIPIIVCSGSRVVARAVETMRAGAFDYLSYPLQQGEFLSAVQNAVAGPPKTIVSPKHVGNRESMGRFAARIAHDFNNFLTVIQNCGVMLKNDVPSSDATCGLLVDEIIQASERAQKFTEQLFAFSKNRRQVKAHVVLDEIIRRLQNMIQRLAGPSIEFEFQLEAEHVHILARQAQIEQTIMNLAVNARDASPDGGVIRIRTSVENIDTRTNIVRPGKYVHLRVEDNGVGMTPETIAKVFEPFFTTKLPDKGTGLGLSIVQEIMAEHGGLITVQSELGRGTTMTLKFPLYQNNTLAAPKMHSHQYVNVES